MAGQRHAAWRLARSAVNYAKEPYKDGSVCMVYMGENDKRAKAAPGLAKVIDAWPDLPEAIRTGILAMIETYTYPKDKAGRKTQ